MKNELLDELDMHATRLVVSTIPDVGSNMVILQHTLAQHKHSTVILTAYKNDDALKLYEAGHLAGVVMAGPEPRYPVKPLHKFFASWHEAGLGIEIHAGEWCGPESVWDALEYGFPDRIGHGVGGN